MQGLRDLERWETYRTTIELIKAHPLLGNGLGSYEFVFPAYRSDLHDTSKTWDYAHNSLLEIAAEQGLIVAAAAVLTALFLMTMLIRGVLIRRRDTAFSLIGLGVLLLAVTHSMVDFPLQIPAYAILCATIVGTALAQSIRSSKAGEAIN
jgi:O-antigen ligase